MIVCSPINGVVKKLEEVNDEVFAGKMMGEGVAIMPSGSVVYSPIKGKVSVVFPTGHAFGLIGEDGVEVLIHIGIDTVELNGEGFDIKIEANQDVEIGTPLVTCDFSLIEGKGYDKEVIIVITNSSNYGSITCLKSDNIEVSDNILEIK